MDSQKFINWCIECHERRNQPYNDYLPYRIHIELVLLAGDKFKHIWENINKRFYEGKISFNVIRGGLASHDILEDSCASYSDLFNKAYECYSEEDARIVANISYACWTEKGKTRADRHNDKYYEGIRKTDGGRFVKLCDRIGNLEFGKLMGKTGMFKKYKKENDHFKDELYKEDYQEMWDYIESLFN